jgi:hypothetical protein
MKKKVIVSAVITGLISGAAFAQTNVVSSANVVGYNQITIASNSFVLVALDFNTASNTVNGLFGNLGTGSQISFWDATAQGYVTLTKLRTGWSPSGTNVLEIGSGAFLKLPSSTNVYLAGDVPMTETTTVYTAIGYKILSYPYPADTVITNTAMAKGAATGDSISLWGTNGWTTFTKLRTGWSPANFTNIQLKVGDALLYKGVTNRTVNEVKPYTIQ